MILSNLKKVCAAYLGQTTSALTVDSVDLFLMAANNAKTNAQLLHNFEASRVLATLDVDGVTGGDIGDATISGNTNETLTVTGTLSPDATGTYIRQGEFSGYPLYIHEDTVVDYIYYNPTLETYVLASALTTGALSHYWLIAPDTLSPIGSYSPSGGVYTGTATVASSAIAAWNGLTEVIAVYRNNAESALVPLDLTRPDIAIERDRYEVELSEEYEPYRRYPSDASLLDRGANGTLILRGTKLMMYPPASVSGDDPLEVYLEGYGRLADYTSTSLTLATEQDFLLRYGATFLQWSIICELNFKFKRYVSRNEGDIGAPEKERDKAWRDLILWDTYLVDSHATRSR